MMMESTVNETENSASVQDENPFKDSEEVVEDVEIHTDADAAAEEARKQEIRQQMEKLQDEIATLRSALERKEKQYADLKKELGITTWSQLREGIGSQINYIQSSGVWLVPQNLARNSKQKINRVTAHTSKNLYNKTCRTLSGASEATSNAFKSAGAATAKKIGELRDSETFKSFENKVSTATSSIKGKMTRSKSEAMEEGIDEVDPNLQEHQSKQE